MSSHALHNIWCNDVSAYSLNEETKKLIRKVANAPVSGGERFRQSFRKQPDFPANGDGKTATFGISGFQANEGENITVA